MTVKKFLAAFLATMLIFALCGCTSDTVADNLFVAGEDKNKNASVVEYDAPTELARNSSLSLVYDPTENRLNINDVASGELLWSTGVTEEEYGKEIVNKLTEKALKQLINIKYTDFGMKNGVENNLADGCETTLRSIENGIRFDFNFKKLKIKLSLEFTLTEKGISVYLPKNSIDESGKNKLTGIDLLAMFGASPSSKEGYLFVPDGSGAIYNFGSSKSDENVLSLDIYDSMLMDLDTLKDNDSKGIKKVSAPVFGVKQNEKVLFANITEGEENCSLTMQTDTGVYAVNRIYPVIRFRKQYFMTPSSGVEISAYEKEAYVSDIRIDYTVICGENVGYSEMANAYRDYLQNSGKLKKENTESFSAAIDFLCSVQKDTMLYKDSIVTSSFSDIASMLADFSESGVKVSDSVLYGWQKTGYYSYPESNKISSAAGGKGNLKKLIGANPDTNFYLLSNYMNANAGAKGFSKYTDVVYKIDSVPLTNEKEDKYLLNIMTQKDRFEKNIKLFSDLSVGLAGERVGSMLYEDYESNRRMTRTASKNTISDMIKSADDKGVKIATDGFAPYLSEYADYIFNLSSGGSNYKLLSESVPFLQMVLHGYIGYSDSVPGNLSNDIVKTKLSWVEYGYMPTFLLTFDNSDKLKDTDFNLLFSSEYSVWKDEIVGIYKEMSETLSAVSSSAMISHEKNNGVAKVGYENGKEVIVNYNNEPVTVDSVTVEAKSYIVK